MLYILIKKLGIAKTYERIHELYYRISQEDVIWVLSRCAICAQTAANNNPPTVTPIVSHCSLDRVQIDLMDMCATADSKYKWILQIKNQFSCETELVPLETKESAEVATAMRGYFGCYRHPQKL
jgi:hypothetical protein